LERERSDVEQLETMVGLSVLASSERPHELAERFRNSQLQSVHGLREQLASALRKHEAQRAQIKQLQHSQQQLLKMQGEATKSHPTESQDEKLR
jgi:Mg2+ and Co2+ transporter CorA